jgi:hypothetical protein
MKINVQQLAIISYILQLDKEGKAKQFALAELTTASDIFKEIKKCTKKKEIEGKMNEVFKDGEIELTSEQKVFLTKLIDERDWTVNDAETIFELKKLIK